MLFKEGWKPSVLGQAGLLLSWSFQTSEGARQTNKPVADVTQHSWTCKGYRGCDRHKGGGAMCSLVPFGSVTLVS